MATDLSNVDTNPAVSPADGDPVSAGASKIRDTRTATMNSFGGTNAGAGGTYNEHYLAGPHKFPAGDGTFPALPGVPAVGNAARLFLDTTNNRVLRDTGTVWTLLRTLSQASAYNTTSANSGTSGSFATLQTATINMPTGARLIVAGIANMTSPTIALLSLRIRFDSTTIIDGSAVSSSYTTLSTYPAMCFGADVTSVVASGTHTITFEAASSTTTAFIFNNRLLIALIV